MLVIWLIYSAAAYFLAILPCCQDQATGDSAATTTISTDSNLAQYPITFRAGSAQPIAGDDFTQFRDSIINSLRGNDRLLQITGLYYENEVAPDTFVSMGFARADSVRRLFAGDLPPDRIKVRAQDLVGEMPSDTTTFPGVQLSILDPAAPETDGQPETTQIDTISTDIPGTAEAQPVRILVRFPTNSTERIVDPTAEAFLESVAERLQENERIRIIGHTDNEGSEAFNQQLGMRRAEAIRDALAEKGVSSDRISVESRGETLPVDTNDTEEGKQNNRRAEIRIESATGSE